MTAIGYRPSTVDYVRDMESGRTPESVSPFPSMVVSSVTVSDSLGWEKVTEYYYHDGYYGGCEAEFRGYQEAEVREIGDENSPTSWARTRFHVGERPSGMQCLEDNPYEGLKGQPAWSETFDEIGVFLKTDWSSYKIEYLYAGLDGRDIYQTYGDTSGSFLYDTSAFAPAPEGSCRVRPAFDVEGLGTQQCVPVRSPTNAELRSEIVVDSLGNTLASTDRGLVEQSGDEITSRTDFGLMGTWLQRPVASWVEGNPDLHDVGPKLNWSKMAYDARGNLRETWLFFDYPGDLESPEHGWDISDGSWKLVTLMDYLESGLIRGVWEGVGEETYKRHLVFFYDESYGAFQESESIEVRPLEFFSSEARWDSGFNVITTYTGYNGEESSFVYDALGRIERTYAPGCSEPAAEFHYHVDFPLSHVLSIQNETCQEDSTGAIVEPLSPVNLEGFLQYSYVDGLGRSRGVVKEGDTENPWIVEGHAVFDAKGAVAGSYLPYAVSGRWAFNPLRSPQPLIGRTLYDAFGRTIREFSPDGEDFTGTTYGLLRSDLYERSDFVPGVYFGTMTTQKFDGLGRVTRVIDRLRNEDGSRDLLATDYIYDTIGNMVRLESGRLSGGESSGFEGYHVVKTSRYDSNGVEIFQDDPDRGRMYFVYNELGDLLRWQDGRGVTNGYGYDLGGRLVSEDYGYTGINDVIYGYDMAFDAPWYTDAVTCHCSDPLSSCPLAQRNLLGRLSYIEDRSGTKILSYDQRGQVEWLDTQLSSYEEDEDLGQWVKHSDLSQVWHMETHYDEMGRTVWEDFPEEGSRVFYGYSERSLIDSVFLDRPTWLETRPVISKVYYDETGKQTRIEYGDEAGTAVEYTYDMRQRLVRLMAQQQSYVPDDEVLEERTLMDYGYRFDEAGNISAIIDHRDSFLVRDWSPVPVNYYYDYDSLNRLTRARPVYHEPQPDRVGVQEWSFDKLGSMKTWTDPAHRFYGWSLSHIRNGFQLIEEEGIVEFDGRSPAPHALYKAYDVDPDTGRGSFLVAHYDGGGYMSSLEVYKGCGECSGDTYRCELPCESAELTQFFWDEVGRLQEARKLEGVWTDAEYNFGLSMPAAHYQYTYDSSNVRTVKVDAINDSYALYLSGSFEIRNAHLSSSDSFISGDSIKYVSIFGNRIARIAEDSTWLPGGESYSFLYFSNHLGSTSIIVDSDSSEVIEARIDLPYGAPDASLLNRDPSYAEFTAHYSFTGKEEDSDIDLFYFGERYYNCLMPRWISSDRAHSRFVAPLL